MHLYALYTLNDDLPQAQIYKHGTIIVRGDRFFIKESNVFTKNSIGNFAVLLGSHMIAIYFYTCAFNGLFAKCTCTINDLLAFCICDVSMH